MKIFAKAIGIAALLLTAGCEVNVDNNLEAAFDNQTEALGEDLENAAEDAGNAIDQAGASIENGMDAIGNGFDVDVNVNRDDAAANTQ